MKNAQQNTRRQHASHKNIRVTHPCHPLVGQVVTVCRIYQRRKDQAYWDIALPDGSRAFVPDSWTETTGNQPSTGSQELALSALRNLATIVAELQDRICQKGAAHNEPSGVEPVPGREPAVVGPVAGRGQPETHVPSCGERP